jgi:putative flippase GtrA
MLQGALRGHELWARILRFAAAGGISTALYGLFTWGLVGLAQVPPLVATVVGYLLVLPVNFFLQKLFTFRSESPVAMEAPRFALVHGANIAISAIGMHVLVGLLHADYRLGIVLTMALVPFATFLAMHLWVFGGPGSQPR